MISSLKKVLSNIPGWRTKRKIVVFESDDWGSIRMSSKSAIFGLVQKGIPVDKDHYNMNDGLESNEDLELLMEVLSKYKDVTGNPAIFTGANIVANPDFEKIADCNFDEYHYEEISSTLKRYPSHDRIEGLWREGIVHGVLLPQFHGREHLNVQLWMQDLRNGNENTLNAFRENITGIPRSVDGRVLGDYQAAFDIQTKSEIVYQKEVIRTGLDLFEKSFGFRSRYFVPPNGPINTNLDEVLLNGGIEFLNTGKIHNEPLGKGEHKKHFRYLGKSNGNGITYITRNAIFEPNSWEYSASKDWVGACLQDIDLAFKFNKPAVISTHRVNYVGWLNTENRDKGLRKLDELLKGIISKWPDVEFKTSVDLGEMIKKSKEI
jgi:hypothetical protein